MNEINLKDDVEIVAHQICGVVVVISSSIRSGIQYLVEYKDSNGRLAEWWVTVDELKRTI